MFEEYQEQIALNGTRPGRPESPALEGAASKAIEDAFRELIENSYFYQKITVDLTDMDEAIKHSIEQEKIERGRSIGPPRGPGPIETTRERLEQLHGEVRARPWRLATRHAGDDPTIREIGRFARAGAQPFGTDVADMNLYFYLPPVRLHCATCKNLTAFTALVSSTEPGFGTPYPRKVAGGTEQIFFPEYRCEMCRKAIHTMLIRRVGLRLHLCGFAPRREALPAKGLTEELLPILNDAEQAVAEGDLYGGCYHLRTMLEHYLKAKLKMPLKRQIRGDELSEKYYALLEPGIKGLLPSVSTAWENLSEYLHTRTGEAKDYQNLRDDICKHIEIVAALGSKALTTDGSTRATRLHISKE